MMELHTVVSGQYAEPAPSKVAIFEIDATIEGERATFTFVSVPTDWNGLSADVAAWLLSHPDFEIAAYVDPPPVDPLTFSISKRQAVMSMVKGAFIEDPDAAVEAAINTIADAQVRGLARTDWRYAGRFWRQHALFNDPAMLAAMNMNAAQVDGLWLLALQQPE